MTAVDNNVNQIFSTSFSFCPFKPMNATSILSDDFSEQYAAELLRRQERREMQLLFGVMPKTSYSVQNEWGMPMGFPSPLQAIWCVMMKYDEKTQSLAFDNWAAWLGGLVDGTTVPSYGFYDLTDEEWDRFQAYTDNWDEIEPVPWQRNSWLGGLADE